MHIYAIFDKELLQDKGAEYAADLAGAKEILKTMHRTLVEQNDGAHHADLCIALVDVSTTLTQVTVSRAGRLLAAHDVPRMGPRAHAMADEVAALGVAGLEARRIRRRGRTSCRAATRGSGARAS